MHPQLDLIDEIVRILGWPTLLGILVWVIRTYDKGQQKFAELDANTKTTVATVADVKEQVDKIQSNHLAHLQEGITNLSQTSTETVKVLHEINTGINVLVDRTPRR